MSVTIDKLQKKLGEIRKTYNEKCNEIYCEYVNEIKKASIGDIVADSALIIKITSIRYSLFGGNISIYYIGKRLSKKLVPFKSDEEMSVFENCGSFKIIQKAS